MLSFNCGNNSKITLKSISKSQSKHNKFEEYKKCLDEEEFQKECDINILKAINLEMYPQK